MDKPKKVVPPAPPGTLALTIDETAVELRVSRATVYRLIGNGKLTPIRIGGHSRIPRTHLEAYMQGRAA